MSFEQQLILTLIDKAVIGGLLALTAYGFSRLLEAFKADRSKELEAFKLSQAQTLESFKSEESRKLESFKSVLAAEGEANRNLRLAVAEVAKRLAAGIHTINWFSWIATYSPQELRVEHFESYEKEMHLLLSELVGTRAVLAALHRPTHEELTPLIRRLYTFDAEVGMAKALYLKDPDDGRTALAKLYQRSEGFPDELLEAVSNLTALNQASPRIGA